ncbi:hypothetical protein MKX03_019400 [Papaver bracteatum]|nr:hypothetical protein MKX03_019400 [Papaver bracteatum]
MNAREKKAEEAEFSFVLCLPFVFRHHIVGAVLKEFTNIGLKLANLRCVSVTRKFIDAHFEKEGRSTLRNPSLAYLGVGPFVAMKLEGHNAVKEACRLVAEFKKFPMSEFWPFVYSSVTVEKALEDAATWFRDDSIDSLLKEMKRNRMIFNLPDCGMCGGLPVKIIESIVDYSRIAFSLASRTQRFVLIKPKAFEKGIIPDLLSTIEEHCLYMKGLKMVKKSEVPESVAWSDDNSSSSGETQAEEFGIALIALLPDSMFDTEGSLIIEKDIIGEHVSSEFVFVSAADEWSLKFVEEFFKFGVVGWLDQSISPGFHGGYFDSTLIGLQFEDQDDPNVTDLIRHFLHPDHPAIAEFSGGS